MTPALLAVAVVLVALAGCNHKGGVGAPTGGSDVKPAQARLARKVQVAPVEERDLTYQVETVGTLEPERQSAIAAGVPGVVDEVLFHEGDVMDPQRTVLIKIDQRKYSAAAALAKANEERAQAKLEMAEDNAQRAKDLREKRVNTVEELRQRVQEWHVAEAELAAVQAERRMADLLLTKSRVRPPYAGQINERLVAVGDYVKEETVIGRIADISTLRLSTFIPELAATRAKLGDTVEFTLEAMPKKKFQAKIAYISTVADAQTHMFACKADVSEPGPDMKPGMFARVQIPIEHHEGTSVVPEESVRPGEQGFLVYVPEQDIVKGERRLVAKARRVQIGLRQPGFAEILTGVEPGEQVVTRGSDALEDGIAIEIVSDQPTTVTKPTAEVSRKPSQ